jgi:hypothetical protein
MNNQINEIRRKIKSLRRAMLESERAMQAEIAHDRDCGRPAQILIRQRREMARLVSERKALGDLTPIHVDLRQLPARNWGDAGSDVVSSRLYKCDPARARHSDKAERRAIGLRSWPRAG